MNKKEDLLKQKKELEEKLKIVNSELDDENVPKQISLDQIDFTNLRILLDEIMDDYKEDGRSKDDEYRVYETVMELFYGKNFFDWLNEKIE